MAGCGAMIRCRHELKYLVTEAQAVAIAECIRPYMRPDRHSVEGAYTLASLYLDSADLRLYAAARHHVKNRIKLRIRSYSDDANAPCFFEIKRRINQVCVKSRACVPRWALGPLLTRTVAPSAVPCDGRRNLEQFLYYRRAIHAAPLVLLRYARQAFESRRDDDVRVTFDRQLSFKLTEGPTLSHNGGGWHRPPEHRVVLEIKFTRGYPPWISRLAHVFGLRQRGHSKYGRAVAHELRLGTLVKRPDLFGGALVGVGEHGPRAAIVVASRSVAGLTCAGTVPRPAGEYAGWLGPQPAGTDPRLSEAHAPALDPDVHQPAGERDGAVVASP